MVPNITVDMFAYPCVSHSSNYKSGLFDKTRAGMVKLLHPCAGCLGCVRALYCCAEGEKKNSPTKDTKGQSKTYKIFQWNENNFIKNLEKNLVAIHNVFN